MVFYVSLLILVMKRFLFIFIFVLFRGSPVLGQDNVVDSPEIIKLYRVVKELGMLVLGRTGEDVDSYHADLRHQGRVQKLIPKEVPFPCNVTEGRSQEVPKSVNKLRPGDIDIIAAMGDSLTAGSGIFAQNVFHLAVENRGASALGGGQATWREYLTIPNIIKEFNPNLIGYAMYDSFTHQKESELNVAEIGAMSRDLPFMAENLIRRMMNNPKVDLENSWKLISILIGGNDLCSDICWAYPGPRSILEKHKKDLIQCLRILRENLPRSLVSIVPIVNIIKVTNLPGKSLLCEVVADIECQCVSGLPRIQQIREFNEIIKAWQRIDEEVGNYPEFQTEEFAVVVQPFSTNLTFPLREDGTPDWRYFSRDCFHMSQIANAQVSRAIWKNMLEPAGRKSRDWDLGSVDSLSCPSELRPYIATLANSRQQID